MPARFSQQHQRVRPNSNEDKVVARAKEHFEKTLIEMALKDSEWLVKKKYGRILAYKDYPLYFIDRPGSKSTPQTFMVCEFFQIDPFYSQSP